MSVNGSAHGSTSANQLASSSSSSSTSQETVVPTYQELTNLPSITLPFADDAEAEVDADAEVYNYAPALEPRRHGGTRWFSKELRCLLYGFGDDENPYTETVDMLEDLLIEFITETTHKCMEIGRTGRIQVEDIIFLVRKDPKKYSRVKELLTMNEELKKARKAFDEQKY